MTYTCGEYRLVIEKNGIYYDARLFEGEALIGEARCPSYDSGVEWARHYFGIEF